MRGDFEILKEVCRQIWKWPDIQIIEVLDKHKESVRIPYMLLVE